MTAFHDPTFWYILAAINAPLLILLLAPSAGKGP